MSATLDSALGSVVDGARIVVTVGSGGVGGRRPPPSSACAARAGKRVLVMTVTPRGSSPTPSARAISTTNSSVSSSPMPPVSSGPRCST